MDVNKVHKVLNKLNSRKMSSVIFSLVDQNPSNGVQNTFQQINYLQNATIKVKSSCFELCQGKTHKTNSHITIKGMKTQFCQRSKNALNHFFGDEQEEFPGGFPMGKGTLQSTMGAAASPAHSTDASFGEGAEMVPPPRCFSPPPWHCSAWVQALGNS